MKLVLAIGAFFAAAVPIFTIAWWETGQASSIQSTRIYMTAQNVEIEELKKNQAQLQRIHIEQSAREQEKLKSNKALCRIGKLPREWCRVQGFEAGED
jgi:hypothetical protein